MFTPVPEMINKPKGEKPNILDLSWRAASEGQNLGAPLEKRTEVGKVLNPTKNNRSWGQDETTPAAR
jgi:hypothetical protein